MNGERARRDERERPTERGMQRAAEPAVRRPQARLKVGSVDDPLEREADRAADDVLAALDGADGGGGQLFSSTTRISRRAGPAGAAAGPASSELDPLTDTQIRGAGGGEPIADTVRQPLEQAFGADLSGVRIHPASALAPRLGAEAFTVGSHIHFAPDRYRPTERTGRWLLSHELAHVVQQGDATVMSSARVRRKEDAELIGANQVGDAPLDLSDAYAYRYVFRALTAAQVKAITKETLTAELANAVAVAQTDVNWPATPSNAEAQQILNAYKAQVDAHSHDESFQTYDATWNDNSLSAITNYQTVVNALYDRLKSQFLVTARRKHRMLENELGRRERDLGPSVGAGPDNATRAQFAAALRTLPGFKEVIAAVKSGGVKERKPVIGFKDPAWKDGGKLVDKVTKVPGGPNDSPVNDTPDELKLMKEKVQKADNFYRALVEPSLLETIPRPTINYHLVKAYDVVGNDTDANGKNAYVANQSAGAINFGQGVFPHIVIHELGHYVEDNLPREQWAAIALLLRARHTAAGGGNLVAGPGGARQQGNYPATGPYTSRAYATGTEVTSMTLEELSQAGNVDAMIDQDPQQVAVVIRALRPKAYAAHNALRPFDRFLP